MQTTTIRPGLLVSLKTSVAGNVKYDKRTIESDHLDDDGARRARWETERTVIDPAEHEEAIKIRGKARSLITGICASSTFGLLCPNTRADELSAAIRQAQDLAAQFNSRASLTRVSVYIIAGRIAQDDVEAIKAINDEVTQLLNRMERGVRALDVETIRKAANDAKSLGGMLTPEASARLQVAIDSARTAARALVKAGEIAGAEIDIRAVRAITESRTAFLDIDTPAQEIASPVATGRALDLDPTTTAQPAIAPTVPALDMDDEPTKLAAAPLAPVTLDLF